MGGAGKGGGGLKSIHGGSMGGGLKMLSKNACDRVHLIVKLLAISSWKGALHFSEGGLGCFSDGEGGFIFKWGASVLMEGGGFKKIFHWGEGGVPPSCSPLWENLVMEV